MNVLKLARAHLRAQRQQVAEQSPATATLKAEPTVDEEASEERLANVQAFTSTLPTFRGHWARWWNTCGTYVWRTNSKCAKCRHRTTGFTWPVLCPVCGTTYCDKCYGNNNTLCYNKGCFKCAHIVERIEYLHTYVLQTLEQGVFVAARAVRTVPEQTDNAAALEAHLWNRNRPHRSICGNPDLEPPLAETLAPIDASISTVGIPRYDADVEDRLLRGEYGWLHYDVDMSALKFRALHRPSNVPLLDITISVSVILTVTNEGPNLHISSADVDLTIYEFEFEGDELARQWCFFFALVRELLAPDRCYSV